MSEFASAFVELLDQVDESPERYAEAVEGLLASVQGMAGLEAARALLHLRRDLDARVRVTRGDGAEPLTFSELLRAYLTALRSTETGGRQLAEVVLGFATKEAVVSSVPVDTATDVVERPSLPADELATKAVEAAMHCLATNERYLSQLQPLRDLLFTPEESGRLMELADWDAPFVAEPCTVLFPEAAVRICRDVHRLVAACVTLSSACVHFPEIVAYENGREVFSPEETADSLIGSLTEIPDDLLVRIQLVDVLCSLGRTKEAVEQAGFILDHPEHLGTSNREIQAVECSLDEMYRLDEMCRLVSTADDLRWRLRERRWLEKLEQVGYRSSSVLEWVDSHAWGDRTECVPSTFLVGLYASRVYGYYGDPESDLELLRPLLVNRRSELLQRPDLTLLVLKEVCFYRCLEASAGAWVSDPLPDLLDLLGVAMLAVGQASRLYNFSKVMLARQPDELLPAYLREALHELCGRAVREGGAEPWELPAMEPRAREAVDCLQEYRLSWQASRPEPHRLVREIEKLLHRIVFHVLKQHHGGEEDGYWRQGVPQGIRISARSRQEELEEQFPKEACIDFSHLKAIIEHNWEAFAPQFEESKGRGKAKSLTWLGRVHKLRNLTAHPPREMHRPPADEEVGFLAERLRWLEGIATKLQLPGIAAEPPGSMIPPSRN